MSEIEPNDLLRLDAAQSDDKAFEDFCYASIDYEVTKRHLDAELDGPAPGKVGDGGRDITLRVSARPVRSRHDFQPALTYDDGEIWYACKTGHHWRKEVHKDVGADRETLEKHLGGSAQGLSPADLAARAQVQTKRGKPPAEPAPELLRLLQGGGRYVVCVNRRVDKKQELRDDLCARLAFWFEARLGHQPPSDLRERIIIQDANDLARFVRHHQPTLPGSILKRLQAQEPGGLAPWETWTKDMEAERMRLRFQSDEHRAAFLQRVHVLLSDPAGQRVLRLVGRPGVGKTRLVHHALEGELDLAQLRRVRYSSDFRAARKAIEDGLCEHRRDLILVIDEVPTEEAESIAAKFRSRASGTDGALILIGTLPDTVTRLTPHSLSTHTLQPLSDAATRTLIVDELELYLHPAPALVDRILVLVQGFPLFAWLLARGLSVHPDALDEPDVASEFAAARLVLAGNWQEGEALDGWQARADTLAKALLVVIMTPRLDWRSLPDEQKENLRRAVKARSWDDLERAAGGLEARGLLRYAESRAVKYVSPYILARIIVNHFFQDGPNDLGPTVREHAGEHRDELYRTASRLSVTQAVLKRLASGELEDLSGCEASAALAIVAASPEALRLAARELPEQAARVLERVVRNAPRDRLGSEHDAHYALADALVHVTRRRISRTAFAQAEEALFRLAMIDERDGFGGVRTVWKSLFRPLLDLTRQPFELRIELLRRRCRAGAPETRLLAMEALGVALDRGHWYPTSLPHGDEDRQDGPWPEPELAAVDRAFVELWDLAVDLTSDQDAAVAGHARELVVRHLVSALETLADRDAGARPLAHLVASIGGWTVAEAHALRERLDGYRRDVSVADAPEEHRVVDILTAACAPSSFHERLLDQVGTLHPGPWPWEPREERTAREHAADAALAAEGLAPPCPMHGELDWLESEAARRVPEFAAALGRKDVQGLLLETLMSRAREHGKSRVLPHYLAGVAQREGQGSADAWLEQHLNEPALHPVAVALIVRLGGTDQRMRWLLHMLAIGTITARHLPVLGFAEWARPISTPLLEELFGYLARGDEDTRMIALACGLALATERWGQLSDETRALLASLLEQTAALRLVSVTSMAWKRIALVLLAKGYVPAVIDAAATFLGNDSHYSVHPDLEPVIERLLGQGHADELWRVLAPRLMESPTIRLKLEHTKLLANVSPDMVLSWVGEDEERAAEIAALCAPWTARLGGVSRRLIERFGAESPPADVLLRRASLGPRRLHGVEFLRKQLDHACAWQSDASSEIARWAHRVADALAHALAEEDAEEAVERLYG